MGRRGPKPEPAAVKIAKGNPGNRPIGVVPEAAAPVKTVAPPVWLKDEGLDVWKRLAPMLAAMNILTKIDAWTFGRYCRNFARWLKMNERLDDMGEIYEIQTASGNVRRNDPAYLIADRLERQLAAAEAAFGLNPAERQRLFAARAAAGAQGTLFAGQQVPESPSGRAQREPKPEGKSPLGLLN